MNLGKYILSNTLLTTKLVVLSWNILYIVIFDTYWSVLVCVRFLFNEFETKPKNLVFQKFKLKPNGTRPRKKKWKIGFYLGVLVGSFGLSVYFSALVFIHLVKFIMWIEIHTNSLVSVLSIHDPPPPQKKRLNLSIHHP